MQNKLPDSRTHYEVALANSVERNMLSHHRALDFEEKFTPSYPLSVLIEDYIEKQELEFRQALRTDDMLRMSAVDEIFEFAKDSHEYQPIWDARVKGEENGDFYEAEKLVKRFRARIEQELIIADRSNIRLFDTDEPTDEMIAMLEDDLDEASSVLDSEMYAKQKKRAEEFANGLSEAELKGREDGIKFYEQWRTDPSFATAEVARVRKHFEDGNENIYGEKLDEAYVRGLEFSFHSRVTEDEGVQSARQAEQRAKEAENVKHATSNQDGSTLDEVIQSNVNAPKSEQDSRTADSAEKIKAEKEKKPVNSSHNPYGARPSYTSSTAKSSSSNAANAASRSDAGFRDYQNIPDGDELDNELEEEALTIDTAPEDMIYRAQRPQESKPKGKINKMKKVRKENPKLGKNYGEGMQYGIGIGRNLILPDAEEVDVKKVNFKKRPWRWVKTNVSALYRRHRKSANIVIKLTAFIALQLGVSTMTGRFEFKEDRHFVQMVLMTVFGFLLTSSLAKDGVPVGNAAFIL